MQTATPGLRRIRGRLVTSHHHLSDREVWVVWRTEVPEEGGKPTKVAYQPRRPDRKAASNRPKEWATRDEAMEAWRATLKQPDCFEGIGLMFAALDDARCLGGLDLDACLDDDGNLDPWAAELLALFPTYTERSPSGYGVKKFFLWQAAMADEVKKWRKAVRLGPPDPERGDKSPGIEVYFTGRWFALTYDVTSDDTYDLLIEQVEPERLREMHDILDRHIAERAARARGPVAQVEPPPRQRDAGVERKRLESAVLSFTNNDLHWEEWNHYAMLIYVAFGKAEGRAWLHWFSKQSTLYDAAYTDAKWAKLCSAPPTAITIKSVFWTALHHHNWLDPTKRNGREEPPPSDLEPDNDPAAGVAAIEGSNPAPGNPPPAPSPLSPEGSEDALALELVDEHGHELRYVAQFGQWFHWDGQHWAEDRTVAIYDRARAIARAEANAANKAALRRRLASSATVSGIERLARSDRRIALTIEQFDADPAILNTPGGIIDLRSGLIRPCDPAALCAQITAVAPTDHEDCPTWKAALDLYMDGDSEMVAFLQRLAGYFLWGALVDQIIAFAHGGGGNGKGTFFNTLLRIMGSYAKAAPSEVFLVGQFDRHSTELARLHNARLVIASEIEKGQRWNMPRLNQMSGGDTVTARFMRMDDFEYVPKYKLGLHANNMPSFSKVDEAIRRRLLLLAFNHTVTDQDRAANPGFDGQIKAEWPTILRWQVNGCLDWQREGLNPPQKVLDASARYLDSQNNLAAWLVEGCVEDLIARTSLKDLFASWSKWCEEHGEHLGTSRALADALEERGFKRIRLAGGTRGHAGIRRVIA
jgi:putative DNA primase/helicase